MKKTRKSNKAETPRVTISGVVHRDPEDFKANTAEGFGIDLTLRDVAINGKPVPYVKGIYHQVCAVNDAIKTVEGIVINPKTGKPELGDHFIEKGDFIIATGAKATAPKTRPSKAGGKTTTHSYWINYQSQLEFQKAQAIPRRNRATATEEETAPPRRPRG